MHLEFFRDYPKFPFLDYYKSANQYVGAQQYWLYVLRKSEGFIESDWGAVIRPVNIKQDQTDGLMYWIRNSKDKKEILFHTNSFEGCVNQYMLDNSGMDSGDVDDAINKFGFEPSEEEIRGLTWKEAEKISKSFYESFLTRVEKNDFFKEDATHLEGGYDVPIERLIVVSEVSSDCEPKALQALELFLQDGPAMERVNSVFSSNEEE